jgi:transaldolase
VKLNVTAMTAPAQMPRMLPPVAAGPPGIVSIFAGRVADTGRDPVPMMRQCLEEISYLPNVELLWASPREILNLVQVDDIGCHIITMTNDLFAKIPLIGKNLDEFALDTVEMFHRNAQAAGYRL